MRSRFISNLSIFGVVGSILLLIGGGMQLVSYRLLSESPEMAAVMQASFQENLGVEMTSEEVLSLTLRNGFSMIVFGILSLVVGLGMWRRRRWSRSAAIYLIFFLTIGMVSSAFQSSLRFSGTVHWAGLVLVAIFTAVHVQIILKLRRPEIQSEFTS